MGDLIYNILYKYFDVLSNTGHVKDSLGYKILILKFINDLVYNDYRGKIEESQYQIIEEALHCIFGTTCLIPYPNYLKMGKLHIGDISEFNYKLNKLQEFIDNYESTINIRKDEINSNSNRIAVIENTEVIKPKAVVEETIDSISFNN